jgi:cytochrome c oxidase subunit 4
MNEKPHSFTPAAYFLIFGLLLGLTVLTVAAAELNIGCLHTWAALAIAGIKATLVVLFFMHLWHSSRLAWLVVAASLFFLAILIGIVYEDYHSRSWLTAVGLMLM